MIPDRIEAEYLEYWMDELKREIETADLTAGFEEAIAVVNDGLYQNFSLAVGPTGTSWPPHAPYTVQRYGPHPLLVLSGAMLAAATEVGASGNIHRVSDRSAESGIDATIIPYTFAQNFGWAHIPARPFFYAVDDVVDRATATFFSWAFEIIVSP